MPRGWMEGPSTKPPKKWRKNGEIITQPTNLDPANKDRGLPRNPQVTGHQSDTVPRDQGVKAQRKAPCAQESSRA